MKLIFIIFIILHIAISLPIQIKISNTITLSKFQKKINSILLWLIPFLWALIVKSVLKSTKGFVDNKKDIKKGMHKFYESNIARYGHRTNDY